MRWYEVNSEQLDLISDALLAYGERLTGSVESARKAGLPRQYDMETERLKVVKRAVDAIMDVRRSEH